jgi:hypothetical protein
LNEIDLNSYFAIISFGKKMKIIRKLVLLALSIVAATGVVSFAAWYFSGTFQSSLTVNSTPQISFEGFTPNITTVDVSDTNQTVTQLAKIINTGPGKSFMFSYSLVQIPTNPSCSNITGDVSLQMMDGVPFVNNSFVFAPTGTTNITAVWSIVRSACPQTLNLTVDAVQS